jgi:hypothetical protein
MNLERQALKLEYKVKSEPLGEWTLSIVLNSK